MSRSRRKPYVTSKAGMGSWKRHAKRRANKAVRAAKEVTTSTVRKVFNPWDIDDFGWYWDGPKIRRK